jgi:indolepyruvate ferredoxin oxidoreductase alpha subunit
LGRDTGHIAREGELFAPQIAQTLNKLCPQLALSTKGAISRPRPSRQPLCDNCLYVPIFDALLDLMKRHGGRDQYIVVGDPGCMVRAQAPPYRLLDVKNSLGSSIGQATGLAIARAASAPGQTDKRIIALGGDSSFMHSGFAGLVDLCRHPAARRQVLVILLDNGTTALSGGQPHPASQTDARGNPLAPVDLAALARDAGADWVRVADIAQTTSSTGRSSEENSQIRHLLEAGLAFDGAAVVIARGACPRWLGPAQAGSKQ